MTTDDAWHEVIVAISNSPDFSRECMCENEDVDKARAAYDSAVRAEAVREFAALTGVPIGPFYVRSHSDYDDSFVPRTIGFYVRDEVTDRPVGGLHAERVHADAACATLNALAGHGETDDGRTPIERH